jgi:hypothetical protein
MGRRRVARQEAFCAVSAIPRLRAPLDQILPSAFLGRLAAAMMVKSFDQYPKSDINFATKPPKRRTVAATHF